MQSEVCFFFFLKKHKTNRKVSPTASHGFINPGESLLLQSHRALNGSSGNKRGCWHLPKDLFRGLHKWPAQCVAVQKFQGDTCLPSRSQCKRSEVMFKGRLFLDKAEEAEVASLGSVCGSVYSFPVKAGPAWPKSGSLAGFNGRMM